MPVPLGSIRRRFRFGRRRLRRLRRRRRSRRRRWRHQWIQLRHPDHRHRQRDLVDNSLGDQLLPYCFLQVLHRAVTHPVAGAGNNIECQLAIGELFDGQVRHLGVRHFQQLLLDHMMDAITLRGLLSQQIAGDN